MIVIFFSNSRFASLFNKLLLRLRRWCDAAEEAAERADDCAEAVAAFEASAASDVQALRFNLRSARAPPLRPLAVVIVAAAAVAPPPPPPSSLHTLPKLSLLPRSSARVRVRATATLLAPLPSTEEARCCCKTRRRARPTKGLFF